MRQPSDLGQPTEFGQPTNLGPPANPGFQSNTGNSAFGSPSSNNVPPAGSGWMEIDQMLQQPANPQSRAAFEDTLRNRIRAADNVTAPVPQPPLGTGGFAPNPSGGMPQGTSRYSGNSAQRPPDSNNRSYVPVPPASTTGAINGPSRASGVGFPSSDDGNGWSQDSSIRVGQTFPSPPSDRFGPPIADPGQRREVVFEGQPGAAPNPNQRYITPPSRVGTEEPLRNESAAGRVVDNRAIQFPENGLAGSRPGNALDLPAPPGDGATTPGGANESTRNQKSSTTSASDRPWGPLLMTVLGLFGSLGFNIYLGWIAWDLYARYQDAIDDVQELEAKLEVKQQELAAAATVRSHTSRRSSVASSA